jgi:hypothetical protein
LVNDLVSFLQVVINDQTGNNKAEMTIPIEVKCEEVAPTGSGCGGPLIQFLTTVLGEIPDVGGLVAGAVGITCEVLAGLLK